MSINNLFKSFQQESKKDADFDIIEIDDLRLSLPDLPRRKELIDKYLHSERSDEAKSFWSHLTKRINNVINYLKYNFITRNNYLIMNNLKYIRIFDKIYIDDVIKSNESNLIFKDTIQFTYRSFFDPIVNKGVEYISDCGWGCMLRSAQSILAKGIFMMKEVSAMSDYDRMNAINNTILLFLENKLDYEEIKAVEDFKKVILNIDEGININEVKTVVPPFSIHNICKFAEFFGKDAGEWFSDITMIKIFQAINCELDPMNIEILHFTEGVIYQKELIEYCFVEGDKEDHFTFDDKYYKFDKKGIIFISIRAGLEKVEKEYYTAINELFNIPFNLGIIGGRTNLAHYFIGKYKDKLIYLDPHLNQKSIQTYSELISDNTSYLSKDLYQLDIKNMSAGFTVGFYFRNLVEYIDLTSALNYYSTLPNALFKFLNHPKPQREYNNVNLCDDFEII